MENANVCCFCFCNVADPVSHCHEGRVLPLSRWVSLFSLTLGISGKAMRSTTRLLNTPGPLREDARGPVFSRNVFLLPAPPGHARGREAPPGDSRRSAACWRWVRRNSSKPLFSLLAGKAVMFNPSYCLRVSFIPFNRAAFI